MSQQAKSVLSLSVITTALLTQYRGVTAAGAVVAAAGAWGMGISERPTTVIGEIGLVTAKGTAVAEAGAAITAGSPVAYDALGRVVAATTLAAAAPTITPALGTLAVSTGAVAVTATVVNGAGSITGAPTATSSAPALSGGVLPQYIVGYALQPASAAGDLIEILLS